MNWGVNPAHAFRSDTFKVCDGRAAGSHIQGDAAAYDLYHGAIHGRVVCLNLSVPLISALSNCSE
jgi:hypothetical protein